ncbi:hypothetical protein FKW77_001025 [Venturia effusa]|uniref:Uncharacterized protein n=1 Tax=Venturia effusa TaxID=50376 RepID=A0A517LAD6_9PEZI|nr:hypothetical protein FKW77_001025 [Venturia effusa]
MAEPSRKRRRGSSVVQSVEDIVKEVTALREENQRLETDKENLTTTNKQLITDNAGLQGDISELQKLKELKGKEVWKANSEKTKLENEKRVLELRVSDRDIDIYEQANLIEELRKKLNDLEAENKSRLAAELTDRPKITALQSSCSGPEEDVTSTNLGASSLSRNDPFSPKISSDDHVADDSEIEAQILADTAYASEFPTYPGSQAVKFFHDRKRCNLPLEWVYGRSRRELILAIQAPFGLIDQHEDTSQSDGAVVVSKRALLQSINEAIRLPWMTMSKPKAQKKFGVAMSNAKTHKILEQLVQKGDQLLRIFLTRLIVVFGTET